MPKNKVSKKGLRNLISETIEKALGTAELPKANKKIKKLVDHQSKKLAAEFSSILKHEEKKQKKAEKKLESALMNGEKKKDKSRDKERIKNKDRKSQNGKLVDSITI